MCLTVVGYTGQREVTQGFPRLISVLASIVFLLNSILVVMPRTAVGVHCPTAPQQSVLRTSWTKDCCGHLVSVTVLRKPTLGEPGFKQCRCAEKKASQSAQDRGIPRSVAFPIPAPIQAFDFQELAKQSCAFTEQEGQVVGLLNPPGTPPPNA